MKTFSVKTIFILLFAACNLFAVLPSTGQTTTPTSTLSIVADDSECTMSDASQCAAAQCPDSLPDSSGNSYERKCQSNLITNDSCFCEIVNCEAGVFAGGATAPLCKGQCPAGKYCHHSGETCLCLYIVPPPPSPPPLPSEVTCRYAQISNQCSNGTCGNSNETCGVVSTSQLPSWEFSGSGGPIGTSLVCRCKCGNEVCNECQKCKPGNPGTVVCGKKTRRIGPGEYVEVQCDNPGGKCADDPLTTDYDESKLTCEGCYCQCNADSDCPQGQICIYDSVLQRNVCRGTTLGEPCTNDDDCHDCQRCVDNVCKLRTYNSCSPPHACSNGTPCDNLCRCPCGSQEGGALCLGTCPLDQVCNFTSNGCQCLNWCNRDPNNPLTCGGACREGINCVSREIINGRARCDCDYSNPSTVRCDQTAPPTCGGNCDNGLLAFCRPSSTNPLICSCQKSCADDSDCGVEVCVNRLCVPRSCTSSAECVPPTPVCANGRCFECTADRHCTTPSRPACDLNFTCVECTTDQHCQTGKRCDISTRTCRDE